MALKDFYEDKKFVQSRIIVIRVAAILVFLFLLEQVDLYWVPYLHQEEKLGTLQEQEL
jgi:hypothetical protein